MNPITSGNCTLVKNLYQFSYIWAIKNNISQVWTILLSINYFAFYYQSAKTLLQSVLNNTFWLLVLQLHFLQVQNCVNTDNFSWNSMYFWNTFSMYFSCIIILWHPHKYIEFFTRLFSQIPLKDPFLFSLFWYYFEKLQKQI